MLATPSSYARRPDVAVASTGADAHDYLSFAELNACIDIAVLLSPEGGGMLRCVGSAAPFRRSLIAALFLRRLPLEARHSMASSGSLLIATAALWANCYLWLLLLHCSHWYVAPAEALPRRGSVG